MKISEIADVKVIDRPPVLDKNPGDVKPKKPPMYHVILNNNDYFPGEAVIFAIVEVFKFDTPRAISLMMAAHRNGKAICGTYSRDIAETKAKTAADVANRAASQMAKQFKVDVDVSSYVFTVEPAE